MSLGSRRGVSDAFEQAQASSAFRRGIHKVQKKFAYLSVAALVLSCILEALSVALFVYGEEYVVEWTDSITIGTYNQGTTIFTIQSVLSLIFTLQWLFFLASEEYKVPFIFSFSTLVNLLTCFPQLICAMGALADDAWLGSWVPFFLRIWWLTDHLLSLIDYPQMTFLTDLHREMLRNILSLLATMITCIGVYQACESFTGEHIHFFECTYFIVVTFGTIGYGDIVPTSVMSRLVTIVIIIVAVYRFPLFFSNLADIARQRPKFTSFYSSKGREQHVIVAGSLADRDIAFFLNEFFSGMRRFIKLKIVLLSDIEFTQEVRLLVSSPIYNQRVALVIGDPTKRADLDRCDAAFADALFLVSNTSDVPSAFADYETVMKAMSVHQYDYNLPQHIMLRRERNSKFLSTFATSIMEKERLKCTLLGMGSVLPGTIPFIVNLIRTYDPDDSVSRGSSWREHNEWSMGNELYTFEPTPNLVGQAFLAAVQEFFHFSVTIIGIVETPPRNEHQQRNYEARQRHRHSSNAAATEQEEGDHHKRRASDFRSFSSVTINKKRLQNRQKIILNPTTMLLKEDHQLVAIAADRQAIDDAISVIRQKVISENEQMIAAIAGKALRSEETRNFFPRSKNSSNGKIHHTSGKYNYKRKSVATTDDEDDEQPQQKSSPMPPPPQESPSALNLVVSATESFFAESVYDGVSPSAEEKSPLSQRQREKQFKKLNTDSSFAMRAVDGSFSNEPFAPADKQQQEQQRHTPVEDDSGVRQLVAAGDSSRLSAEDLAAAQPLGGGTDHPVEPTRVYVPLAAAEAHDKLQYVTGHIVLIDLASAHSKPSMSNEAEEEARHFKATDLFNVLRPIKQQNPNTDIVLLTRYDVSSHFLDLWKRSRCDPIFVVKGCGLNMQELRQCNLTQAKGVVVFSTGERSVESNVDAMTMLVTLSVDELVKGTDNAKVPVISELDRIESLSLFPPYYSQDSMASLAEDNFAFEPNFIIGNAICSSMLDPALYQTYFNPFLLRTVDALIYGDGKMAPIASMAAPMVDRYIEVVAACLKIGRVPVGLHRIIEDDANNQVNGNRFMFTNPPPDTKIAPGDTVYFLTASSQQ